MKKLKTLSISLMLLSLMSCIVEKEINNQVSYEVVSNYDYGTKNLDSLSEVLYRKVKYATHNDSVNFIYTNTFHDYTKTYSK